MAGPRTVTFWGWALTTERDGSEPRFEKRAITTDGRTILEVATAKPAAHDFAGVVIPTLEDAHVHLADRDLKVAPGTPIEKVVRPPDGSKHKYLESAPPEALVASIQRGIEDLIAGGVTSAHEFREGGIEGARLYRKALAQVAPERREHFAPVLLGRPGSAATRPDKEAQFWPRLKRLLEVCDGVGLSAISDGDADWNVEVARAVRREGKRVELHCSEVAREPVGRAIDAGASQLVHMVRATEEDFRLVAQQKIAVAVCTRSNEFFGMRAPVELMARAGVDIRIGTDNAFLGAPDLFEEARAFARVHKARAALSPIQILSFMLARKGINGGRPIAPAEGDRPDFLIVTIQTERPDRDLIARAQREDVAAIVQASRG